MGHRDEINDLIEKHKADVKESAKKVILAFNSFDEFTDYVIQYLDRGLDHLVVGC